jgi:hypothetical protein
MARHRRYTKAEKAAAVVSAELSSVEAAADAHGIPESTLRYWYGSPIFAELRAKTQAEGADGWRVIMHLAQKRIAELIPTMDAKDVIVAGGVATEKAQLLGGHATDRTEHRDLANPFDDHETRALVDRAREYLGGVRSEEGEGVGQDEAVAGDRPGEPASS